jgi:predicted NAD/FAD-dependent oxidoreductase
MLIESGIDCVVFDRGRYPGGRVGTKTLSHKSTDIQINHGAPKLDLHEGLSRALMDRFGALDTGMKIVQSPSMRSVMTALATGVPIESSTEVRQVTRDRDQWSIETQRYGENIFYHHHASHIVFACPPVQASRVLHASGIETPPALEQARYASQWVLMALIESVDVAAITDRGSLIGVDGSVFESVELQQVNSGKWVVTALLRPDESAILYNTDPETVQSQMLSDLKVMLESHAFAISVQQCMIHRWGLARAESRIAMSHIAIADMHLSFIGDGFSGPNGEWRNADSSILSAVACAKAFSS